MLQRGFLFIMKGLCRDQRVLTVCLFCKVTAARQHLPPSMLRLAKITIRDDFSDIWHFWANSQEISVVSYRPWSHSERKIIQKVRLRLIYQILSCFVLFGDSIFKSNLCVDTNTVLLNTPPQPLCYFQCLTSNKICCSALGGNPSTVSISTLVSVSDTSSAGIGTVLESHNTSSKYQNQ